MFQAKHQISDVIYNPTERAFEARVTFHTSDGRAVYAASYPAGLEVSFDDAAKGLLADARRQAREGGSLRSYFKPLTRKARLYTLRPQYTGDDLDHPRAA